MISLQVKTEYSLLTSLIKVEDYVRYAKEHQLSSLVLTDTSLFGLMKFYDLCILIYLIFLEKHFFKFLPNPIHFFSLPYPYFGLVYL